ncbi:uncharacterized protein LOC121732982 isoform X2 [Aricia agestis]|uniref:uncharacterized protein LOC121732982 isoform X2 n=1 Tax=Aricia agestis TaxID=91739 RepID=UPI001C20904B|nr:uncharacterized protein LOC121732982 isoform X2 [Aricia agestis]
MAQFKFILALLILCLVCKYECTPLTDKRVEGRGIGSTLWGWITYPFTWWSSGSTDIPADENHITSPSLDNTSPALGNANPALDQDIEIATHNVTVWCNDQTCTTQRCDRASCVNTTCNIYDTDLNGECRHYNTVKPEHDTVKPEYDSVKPEIVSPADKPTTVKSPSTELSSGEHDERPLELEAVLSSTVTEVRDNDTKQ